MSRFGTSLVGRGNSFPQSLLGALLLVLLLPLVMLGTAIALLLSPFARPVQMSAAEVVRYLREFRDGTGDEWDIDDFVASRIADPRLEAIRRRFMRLPDITDPEALAALLAEAEVIAAYDERPSQGWRLLQTLIKPA